MHTALWCIDVCTPAMFQIITVPAQAPCQWQWHHPPQNTDWHSQLASFCVGMWDRAATFTPSDDLRLDCTDGLNLLWVQRGVFSEGNERSCAISSGFLSPFIQKVHRSRFKMRIVQTVPNKCLELVLCLKTHLQQVLSSYSKTLPKCFVFRQRNKVNCSKTVSLNNNMTWHGRQKQLDIRWCHVLRSESAIEE